jgi:hypothetical protein
MRRRLTPLLGIALASLTMLSGCASETDDETGAADEALSGRVLQPSECATVKTPNQSKVAGVFDAPLSACFIAKGNESGTAMVDRAIAIITNPSKIGGATHPGGSKMFQSFKAGAPSGSLEAAGTLTYDAKVGLDIVGPFDAKGTLRFTAQRTGPDAVTLRVTNTTNIGAIGINPLQPNGLQFVVTLTPVQNGMVVTGSVKVTLVSQKDSVNEVSSVAPEIVKWLKGELGAR